MGNVFFLSDSNRVGLVFASVTKPSEVTLVSILCSVHVNTCCKITKGYTWIDPTSVDVYCAVDYTCLLLLVF